MDINLFFQPIALDEFYAKNSLGKIMDIHTQENGFPDLDDCNLAIIGVNESRNAITNDGCKEAPDHVRKYLYQLCSHRSNYKIADLGNIQEGKTTEDTYFALKTSVSNLIKKNILPIIIGGSQDLTFANYLAYQELEQVVNLTSIDNKFDLGSAEDELNSESFLSKIILHQPNFLFNYSNLGYQTYFVHDEAIDLIQKLYFDAFRLGEFNKNIELAEPIIRNADILSFDISSIRMSDAPGCENATPNGLYGEQACQIMRYAGMSDKLSSMGLYEINPLYDNRGQTAQLAAQMIWYFIDGYYSRKQDFPYKTKKECTKYRVLLEEEKYELLFYKSNKSDRWWIEVPYPSQKGIKFERQAIIPCSYEDYEKATADEMPDVWWRTYQKLI